MEPFKEFVNKEVIENLAENLKRIHPSFKATEFVSYIMADLPELELKQRISKVVSGFSEYLTEDYHRNIEILDTLGTTVYGQKPDLTAMCLPEYVSTFGLEFFDFSIDALERYTVFCSSEFAVRDFIIADQERAFKKIYQWKNSNNHHVRRLSSEGSRPRLPWGKKLQALVKNPEPLKEILSHLNDDESEYVRKSVANNLNDISKDNPEWMLDLIESWDSQKKGTSWIIKHAARGLIKQGYPRVFPIFGFSKNPKVDIGKIALENEHIKIGDAQEFGFTLKNLGKRELSLAVDYKVFYIKKTGKSLPKVFKLKEVSVPAGESIRIRKKQSFADVSIRKHYPGKHRIEIVINGVEAGDVEFEVTE